MIERYDLTYDQGMEAEQDGEFIKVSDLLEALQEPAPRTVTRTVHPQVMIRIILRDSNGTAVYSGMLRETSDLSFADLPLANIAHVRIEFAEVTYS